MSLVKALYSIFTFREIQHNISALKYIKDIYNSFAVNTINIFIKCNENISMFTGAKHK